MGQTYRAEVAVANVRAIILIYASLTRLTPDEEKSRRKAGKPVRRYGYAHVFTVNVEAR